jgi:hypothetical protein
MNTFTVNDLEAADHLALARPVTTARNVPAAPPRPQLVDRRVPDMIVTAQEPVDARPPPVVLPVTASRAEMIAASSGRARQQRTPALTGVG